jgi:hypothetical protein
MKPASVTEVKNYQIYIWDDERRWVRMINSNLENIVRYVSLRAQSQDAA